MLRISIIAVLAAACAGSVPQAAPPEAPQPPTAAARPYALAVVMCGWEQWIGNDQVPEVKKADDPARTPGALQHVKAAFEKAGLARRAPAGSQVALVTYSNKAALRLPMGAIDKLAPAAFGEQKDYYGTVGIELVQGVKLAVDKLGKSSADKKYLLVLGDGNDTDNARAQQQIEALKPELATRGIEAIALVYRTPVSLDGNILPLLTARTESLATLEMFGDKLARTLEGLGK